MTYLSDRQPPVDDYHSYGFKLTEIDAFLRSHGLNIALTDAVDPQQKGDVLYPDWGHRIAPVKTYSKYHVTRLLIGDDPFDNSNYWNDDNNVDLATAQYIFDEALEFGDLKPDLWTEGDGSNDDSPRFMAATLKQWFGRIGRFWPVPEPVSVPPMDQESVHLRRQIEDLQSQLRPFEALADGENELVPKELVMALRAWQELTENGARGTVGKTPKQHIEKWLEDNNTGLSASALDRIAILINWKPSGGAPKTPTSDDR